MVYNHSHTFLVLRLVPAAPPWSKLLGVLAVLPAGTFLRRPWSLRCRRLEVRTRLAPEAGDCGGVLVCRSNKSEAPRGGPGCWWKVRASEWAKAVRG